MPSTRAESFTYNTQVVGLGSQGTQILDRFGFDEDESTEGAVAVFVATFLVVASSYSDLASKCNAVEAALRTPYAKLVVNFSSSTQWLYDPDVNASTSPASGFDAAPKLRKLGAPYDTGLSRGYEFRVQVQLPPNYTDAYGAAVGRRTSTVNYHYDELEKPAITVGATYTEIPALLGRAALLADVYAYSKYRIGLIDAVNTYVLTNLDEPDNNSQTIAQFRGTFLQHVFGLRGFRRAVSFSAGRVRTVTYTGTYLAYAASPNQWPTTVTALTAYGDGTHGALAVLAADLAALPASEGGALVVAIGASSNCQLIHEDPTPNQQNTRVDFTVVYREVLFKASNAVTSGLVDPDIFKDSVTFTSALTPMNDSPFPGPANGSGANDAAGGQVSQGPGGTATRGPAAPPNVATQSQGGNATPGTTPVQKPVSIGIRYEAEFLKTMTQSINDKWFQVIRPWLVSQLSAQLGYNVDVDLTEEVHPNPSAMTLVADMKAQALPGNLLAFNYSTATTDDLGKRLSGAYTGQAHNYLGQQALPRRTMRRTITAHFKAGTFNPDQFATQDAVPGWVVLSRSKPDTATDVRGVAGYPQQAITRTSFIEDLLWVARYVPGSTLSAQGGGATPNGGAAQGDGGGGAGASPQAQSNMAAGSNAAPPIAHGTGFGLYSSGGSRDLSVSASNAPPGVIF